jgi:dihydrofolate reductase
MIRAIAAIDDKLGLADERGIPWQGKIPADVAYFRSKTLHGTIVMGYGWYIEQILPLPQRRNVVATSHSEPLRPGFEPTSNARQFLQDAVDDIWVCGGAGLFASTLDLIDELYLTQLSDDFKCTKFFPEFEATFKLIDTAEPYTENGITFSFNIYRRT